MVISHITTFLDFTRIFSIVFKIKLLNYRFSPDNYLKIQQLVRGQNFIITV